jgi:hypothetical protein
MQHGYIFTNSPGEVFSWVRPLCQRLSYEFKSIKIYIFLTPCQYATGEEYRVCQTFNAVYKVYRPFETIKNVYFSSNFSSGTVFFMGGDPMHARRFSKKTKSILVGYSENMKIKHLFDIAFQTSNTTNLMVSGLKPRPLNERKGLVLLPGSRPEHLKLAVPLMLDICKFEPNLTVMLSPFTRSDTIDKLKKDYSTVTFVRMTDPNDLSIFKYAITIPGTNTMQLAYLNIPFLMIFPSHNSKILRMDGVLGLMLKIPIMGRLLQYIILNLFLSKKRMYALPNIYFKKQICPELVGRFSLSQAQITMQNLINHDYKKITQQFNRLRHADILDDLIKELKSRG